MGRSNGRTNTALFAVAVLALIAAALSGYMAVVSARLHAEGLAGPLPICPETDLISCGEVLASRYSQWLGISLAGAGTVNYVLLLACAVGLRVTTSRRPRPLLWTAALALAALGTLAGLWLVAVQIFFVHRFCLLCDIAHACGLACVILLGVFWPDRLAAGLRAGAWGIALAGAAGLTLGQVLQVPDVTATLVVVKPADTQREPLPAVKTRPAASSPAVAGSRPATAPADGLRPTNAFDITDLAGTVIATLDLDDEIILGDPEVKRTIVEFMDYGCRECKQESELIRQAIEKHPKWFRVVVLLFPGNKACNPYTGRSRPYVCDITAAALAAHRHNPARYGELHNLFFQPPQTPLTGTMAWQLVAQTNGVDDSTLQSWKNDPALPDKIRRHCDIVRAIVRGQQMNKGVRLPGLFAKGKMITGAAENLSQLEDHLTQMVGPPDGLAP
jgi:uncharacterized membrane protein/protein-disulfide isomerase